MLLQRNVYNERHRAAHIAREYINARKHTYSGLHGKILSISEEVRWMTKIESKYTLKLFSNDALARANETHSERQRLSDSEMKTPARDAAGMHHCIVCVFVFMHIHSSSERKLGCAPTEEDLCEMQTNKYRMACVLLRLI